MEVLGTIGTLISIFLIPIVVNSIYQSKRIAIERNEEYLSGITQIDIIKQIEREKADAGVRRSVGFILCIAVSPILHIIGQYNRYGNFTDKVWQELFIIIASYAALFMGSYVEQTKKSRNHFEEYEKSYFKNPTRELRIKTFICILIAILAIVGIFNVGYFQKAYGYKSGFYSAGEENWANVEHYVLNKSTNVYHRPTCSVIPNIKKENRIRSIASIEYIEEQGYSPCGKCHP